MATVNVANLVSPVYTPNLLVPTDGSVLTQALLTDLIVALGNRIEFVRDATPEATDNPERFYTIREDFTGAIWTPGEARLDADLVWRTGGDTGLIAVNGVSGAARNPGQLVVSIPANGADVLTFHMQPHTPAGDLTSFSRFRHATAAIRINDDVGNTGSSFAWGLFSDSSELFGGDDCVLLMWLKASDAINWKLLVRKAGVTTVSLATITAMNNNDFVTLRMSRASSTSDILIYADASTSPLYTIPNADVPVVSCTYGAHMLADSADSELVEYTIDFLSLRADTIARYG